MRKNKDYSGVVIWLEPVGRAGARRAAEREEMKQKDKPLHPARAGDLSRQHGRLSQSRPDLSQRLLQFHGQPFDIGLVRARHEPRSRRSSIPGIVRVFCNIHPTMSAIIAVVPTPWYAVTPANGKFTIPNVPPGEYQLHLFHERSMPDI